MMAARAISSAQQTTRNGHLVTIKSNGQQKKMKNSPDYKTVLAPNAPWPKVETPKPKTGWRKRVATNKAPKLNLNSVELDYFREAREQLNKAKIASKSRTRDELSGRFKNN